MTEISEKTAYFVTLLKIGIGVKNMIYSLKPEILIYGTRRHF